MMRESVGPAPGWVVLVLWGGLPLPWSPFWEAILTVRLSRAVALGRSVVGITGVGRVPLPQGDKLILRLAL